MVIDGDETTGADGMHGGRKMLQGSDRWRDLHWSHHAVMVYLVAYFPRELYGGAMCCSVGTHASGAAARPAGRLLLRVAQLCKLLHGSVHDPRTWDAPAFNPGAIRQGEEMRSAESSAFSVKVYTLVRVIGSTRSGGPL